MRTNHRRSTASAVKQHRAALVTALGRAQPLEATQPADLIDMIAGHLEGRPELGQLYVGTRAFLAGDHELSRDEAKAQVCEAIERDGEIIAEVLEAAEGLVCAGAFRAAFAEMTRSVRSETDQHVRTLFIGDCMLVEAISFLIGPLAGEGISFNSLPANARSPELLAAVLDSMAESEFDVVFFSPFSHARLPEIGALLDPKRGFTSRKALRELVDSILAQTEPMLEFISERFDCPIYVHNASLVQRGSGVAKIAAKELFTAWSRTLARERINQWVSDYIEHKNRATHRHLFLLDEEQLADRWGRRALGHAIFDSEHQHAVELSRRVAEMYVDRIATISRLRSKKLVVCDLDNTLWDGVIGEGQVEPLEARQRPLAELRHRGGVVLSIASKNDPKNVHFEGSLLTEQDFVAPQIHWGPKESSIATIRDTLNLQTKHMVFVDDRPDERERVAEAFPDLLVLDACDDTTWRRMALWAELAAGSSEVDRTRMYKEREQRNAFVQEGSSKSRVSVVDSGTL
ncbi:MAG TPA: HAD-IIIC family phosphatase, partial [Polyangiaceae bacterium]|nr:HAD-IIIC family phosphatase [Polyangiaceae bacterium]